MSNINFKKNLFGNYYVLEYQLNNDYPLEKYLENEDAIMCTRNMSDKVKKYFNSEIIKQLIKYITQEPEEDDLLKGHKFPYVASEILKSDCPFILQRFILSEKEYYNEYKEILDANNAEKNNDDDSSSNSSSEEENENKNKNEDENGIIFVNEDEQNNNEINKEKIIDNNNNNDKEIVTNNDIENKSIELNKNNNKIDNNKNEVFNNDKKENEEILDDNKNIGNDKVIDNDKDKQRVNIEEKEIKKEEKNNLEIKEPKIDSDKIMDIDNNPENDINEINNKNNIEDKQNEKDEEKNIQKKEENNNVKETDININKEKMEINNDIAKNENQKTDLNENENIYYKKKEEEIKEKDLINNNKSMNKIVNNENEEKEKVENKEYNDENNNEIEIGNEVASVSFGSDSEYNENQNNEYFDLLLDFVMNDKPELNYVLSGYFSNVISTLLEKYPSKVFYYLYTVRKDALKKIIFRSHQRVFSIISSKLLNLENNNTLKESNKFLENYINFRNELISDTIKSISLDGFKDENNNIYNNIDIESKITFIFMIINDNKYVLEYILEKNDIYGHILGILDINLYEEKYCYNNFDNKYFIYGLLIDLLSKIIKFSYNTQNFEYPKEFLNDNVEKEKSMLTFNDYVIITFCHILKNNFVPKKPPIIKGAGSSMAYEGLGILVIKILQLVKEMFSFMKEIPNKFDLIVINNEFCQRSLDFFFKYQLNNIYHIKFIELFNIYLKEEIKHNELTKFFFDKYKLHEVLINYLKGNSDKQKLHFKFKSGKTIKTGIYPHVINIIYKLQVIGGLSILNKEEIRKLKILNLGEFEFLKDENSNKSIQKLNTSTNIGKILEESQVWKETINTIVGPLIKNYEKQLCKEDAQKKNKDSNANNNCMGIDLLLDYISKGRDINNEKSMNKIRRKIIMGENIRNKRKKMYKDIHNDMYEDFNKSENNNENNDKDKEKNNEQNNEQNNNNKEFTNNISSNTKIENEEGKEGNNIKKEDINDKNNNKTEENSEKNEENIYNDVNFWEMETRVYLNEKEMEDLLNEL